MSLKIVLLLAIAAGLAGIAIGYFLRLIISLGKKGSMELEIKQMMLEAKEEAKKITSESEKKAEETANESRKERQAFVFWEDSDEANGSIVGTELSARGANGELLKFGFRGSIQFGLEMYDDEPPKVFQGTFATGRRFVPKM